MKLINTEDYIYFNSSKMERYTIYPYLFMIIVVMTYAGNILVGKAINELPPLTITFLRLFIAFVALLPIGLRSAWNYRRVFLTYKGPILIMTFTGITLFNTLIYASLRFTTTTKVSVIESAIPVATVILSAFLLSERLRIIQWFGVFVSLTGAVWVIMDGKIFNLALIDWNIGDLLMVGAIVVWAIYSIYVKRYIHLFPPFGSLLVMTGLGMVVIFPIVIIEWFINGVPAISKFENITGLIYLGIFPSLIAFILYNRAVEILNPSKAGIFLNFLPIVTMAGAYLWLNETISLMQIVGALIVVGGVILTTYTKESKQLKKPIKLN